MRWWISSKALSRRLPRFKFWEVSIRRNHNTSNFFHSNALTKDSSSTENNLLRTNTRGPIVAMFSKELSSWDGPFCASQRQELVSRESTNSGHVLVLPSIRPAIQTPAQVLVAMQAPALLPQPRSASSIPVQHSPPSHSGQPASFGEPSSEHI
jgi:hypothetical protein